MQDDDFSKLPQAEYDGVVFPYVSVRLTSGSAAAFHKFPHRPGQRIEYTGREPISGSIVCPMFATLINEKGGSHVYWPTGIALLREKAQEQKSKRLVVPVFGTLDRAFIRVEESYDGMHRDGAYLTINFTEDSTELVSKGTPPTAASKVPGYANDFDNNLAALALAAQQRIEDSQGNTYSDFATTCAALLAMKDQAQTTLADRITMANRVIVAIDNVLSAIPATLTDPIGWQARDAALNLKSSIIELKYEGSAASAAVKSYVVSKASTVVDIATATYNTVEEVLALNTLPNGTAIDEGEVLTVYSR